MTPFQELRLWLRRAPLGQRAAAATACVLALALLVLVLVPSVPTGGQALLAEGDQVASPAGAPDAAAGTAAGGDDPAGARAPASAGDVATGSGGTAPGGPDAGTGSARTGTGTGSAGAGGAGAGSARSGAGSGPEGAPAASPGSTTSRGGGGRAGGAPTEPGRTATSASCPQGSAPGVTATEIELAIILVKIVGPAGNGVFGLATPEQQRGYWKKVLADLNAGGGAGCRRVVATYYDGNPADRNQLQEMCLEIEDSGAYAVLDNGAYAAYPIVECYPRKKIPYFGALLAAETVRARSYPYLFQMNTQDQLNKDTVFALRDTGFFSPANGFTKLAFPYRTCDPVVIKKMRGWLGQAGISRSQIVEYDFGCPNALANPSDLQQAVLTFQRAGATHLTSAGFTGDFGSFTRVAEQQRFRPKYGLPNDYLVPLSKGSGAPDPDNIAGAIGIGAVRDGEEYTPGMEPTAGTARCSRIMGADVYRIPAAAGNSCSLAWMFDAAVSHAATMARSSLAPGLQKAASVELSFPQGPNDFTAPRTTTGGQFWRSTRFTPSCRCWRVADATYRPSYR